MNTHNEHTQHNAHNAHNGNDCAIQINEPHNKQHNAHNIKESKNNLLAKNVGIVRNVTQNCGICKYTDNNKENCFHHVLKLGKSGAGIPVAIAVQNCPIAT